MKKIILLFITFLCIQNSFSQISIPENDIQKRTYNNEEVQVKAEFPNGERKFNEFVLENFKNKFHKDFPNAVLVGFIVDIDGSVNDIEIISGASNATAKKIKKIIKTSPKWLPGEHEGYRVKTKVITTLKLHL
ncbi:hypothetical protein [Flavobacterium sp. CF136]|uniref:hypothetical protein n=1 Tax=Flavobacterium sp. (strain CF136) TaxID=1144313 RepID=UPI000271B8B5|nr:hypothetical protein [Flavobacterium sp. CF136]EJL66397.1 hypothetical protein PMI10_00747 [Flavobacterium sp. CF136]